MVEDVYGFDLRRFSTIVPKRQVVARQDLNIQFLSEDVEAFQFDFESESIWHPDAKTLHIQIKTTGRCLGIIQWIRLYMDRSTVFENHPADKVPATSWPLKAKRSTQRSGWPGQPAGERFSTDGSRQDYERAPLDRVLRRRMSHTPQTPPPDDPP